MDFQELAWALVHVVRATLRREVYLVCYTKEEAKAKAAEISAMGFRGVTAQKRIGGPSIGTWAVTGV